MVNWKRFQHDVRRTTIWVKLYRDLLDRREWRELGAPGAKLLIDLWLIAAQFKNGEITLPLADIAWRLRLDVEAMVTDLQLLASLSFIEVAQEALAGCGLPASPDRGEERRGEERRKSLSATPNWVASFCEVWQERFQGIAPGGRIGRALKPLRGKHSDDEIRRRWTLYLTATEAKFASPEKFAQTFGDWDGARTAGDRTDFLPGETVDQYIARHANG